MDGDVFVFVVLEFCSFGLYYLEVVGQRKGKIWLREVILKESWRVDRKIKILCFRFYFIKFN